MYHDSEGPKTCRSVLFHGEEKSRYCCGDVFSILVPSHPFCSIDEPAGFCSANQRRSLTAEQHASAEPEDQFIHLFVYVTYVSRNQHHLQCRLSHIMSIWKADQYFNINTEENVMWFFFYFFNLFIFFARFGFTNFNPGVWVQSHSSHQHRFQQHASVFREKALSTPWLADGEGGCQRARHFSQWLLELKGE